MKNEEKMLAAMIYGIKDLRVGEIPKPKVEHGEVLVKVRAATTCGTDLKIFQRGYVEGVIKLPTAFGHEWAGEVVEVGEDVSWPAVGMRVRAGNSAPCLRCHMCQRGSFNMCENMMWLWGAYAEYIKVPARMVLVNMQEIPSGVSFEEAAIAEPLACVLRGDEKANIKLGDSVAIIGAGPIGLLHLLTARRMGAEKIIMTDLVEDRLEFARLLGADETVNAQLDDVVKRTKELTENYGADVVIEAIGQPSTWEQALRMVRKGGTVLEFGGCPPNSEIKLSTELLHYGDITVIGAFHTTPTHFKKALNLIASKAINVEPLITRRIPLAEIREAFETLITSKKDVKIAINP